MPARRFATSAMSARRRRAPSWGSACNPTCLRWTPPPASDNGVRHGSTTEEQLMADQSQGKAMQVDPELVRQLAVLLDDTNLTEIEIQDGERRIKVARNITVSAAPTYAAPAAAATAAPAAAPAP